MTHRRALLVEDNPADVLLITALLDQQTDTEWHVERAGTLHEARELVLAVDVDCIMLDLALPDGDGLEPLMVLAAAAPDVPIVVVTGSRNDALAVAALAEGAQDYLVKHGLDAPTLGRTVLRAIQRKPIAGPVAESNGVARAVLDSIESPMAALDGHGRIIAVNTAWRRAAVAGGVSPSSVGVGVDYLAVCDLAEGASASGAAEAAAGIRGVLAGDIPSFSAQYACHTLRRERWVSMRVSPLGAFGGGAVIKHLDITELRRAERALAVDESEFAAALDRAAQVFMVVDDHGLIQAVSEATSVLFGFTERELLGASTMDWVHPADLGRVAQAFARIVEHPAEATEIQARVRDSDHRWHEVDVMLANRLQDPRVDGIVIAGNDITQSNRQHLVTHLESQLLYKLPDAVIVVDDAGIIVYWNKRAVQIFGHDSAEAIGRSIRDIPEFHTSDETADDIGRRLERGERWATSQDLRCADGSIVSVYLTFENIDDPELGFHGAVATGVDISERRRLEEDLAYGASHDAMTDLPNRSLFEVDLERQLGVADDPNRPSLAVVLIDLDDLKRTNDLYGYQVGDALLRHAADAIRPAVGGDDVVGRFVGDQFVVSCAADDAVSLANRLRSVLERPFRVGTVRLSPSASIGVAYAEPGDDAQGLLRDADAAMRRAKALGNGRIELFDAKLEEEERTRSRLETGLTLAVERQEISVRYQPQIDLFSGRITGVEALARWEHPTLGPLGADRFIPVAERSGAITLLGNHVLRTACEAAATWPSSPGRAPPAVAVNVSPRQLLDPSLPARVASALDETGLPPERLCLEITETTLIEQIDRAVSVMHEVKEMGVALALDDFGTGYSSLAYLRRLPVDCIKLDRSFAIALNTDRRDSAVVSAVVSFARVLDLELIAEGVETEQQRDELMALGCRIGQGFLWHRPMTAEALRPLLDGET